MIRVIQLETTYPAPEDDDSDYCPDGETVETMEELFTFRELVALMQEHPHPSCSPAAGSTREWLSSDSEQDYRTGEWTVRTLHYSRENEFRNEKYWQAAMKAAGIVRN